MEETGTVYARGHAGRGREVIRALEERGGENATRLFGNDCSGWYMIGPRGTIEFSEERPSGEEIILREPRKERYFVVTATEGSCGGDCGSCTDDGPCSLASWLHSVCGGRKMDGRTVKVRELDMLDLPRSVRP